MNTPKVVVMIDKEEYDKLLSLVSKNAPESVERCMYAWDTIAKIIERRGESAPHIGCKELVAFMWETRSKILEDVERHFNTPTKP